MFIRILFYFIFIQDAYLIDFRNGWVDFSSNIVSYSLPLAIYVTDRHGKIVLVANKSHLHIKQMKKQLHKVSHGLHSSIS